MDSLLGRLRGWEGDPPGLCFLKLCLVSQYPLVEGNDVFQMLPVFSSQESGWLTGPPPSVWLPTARWTFPVQHLTHPPELGLWPCFSLVDRAKKEGPWALRFTLLGLISLPGPEHEKPTMQGLLLFSFEKGLLTLSHGPQGLSV